MASCLQSNTALFVVLALSTGCASKPVAVQDQAPYQASGTVDGTVLDAPSTEQYEARAGESFLRPHKVPDNAPPIYPAHLLSSRLPPVEVQVRIVVNAEGSVTSATALGQADGAAQPFLDAVVSAVWGWRFYSLFKIDASGHAVKLPFHQDYSFTFKQVNGKGVVSESPGQS